MNIRRAVLSLLVIILGIILAYNYWIMNYAMQRGMGMGMHGRMWVYGQSGNMIDLKYIWIVLIAIFVLLVFDFIQPSDKIHRCHKCGKEIENKRWSICPICGTRISHNRGE